VLNNKNVVMNCMSKWISVVAYASTDVTVGAVTNYNQHKIDIVQKVIGHDVISDMAAGSSEIKHDKLSSVHFKTLYEQLVLIKDGKLFHSFGQQPRMCKKQWHT